MQKEAFSFRPIVRTLKRKAKAYMDNPLKQLKRDAAKISGYEAGDLLYGWTKYRMRRGESLKDAFGKSLKDLWKYKKSSIIAPSSAAATGLGLLYLRNRNRQNSFDTT